MNNALHFKSELPRNLGVPLKKLLPEQVEIGIPFPLTGLMVG